MRVSIPIALLNAYPDAEWDGLELRLIRIYQGVAYPPKLLVTGLLANTVAIWHILEGQASAEDRQLHCQAGPGEWLVCLPGQRLQCFANSTRLLSIHLRVQCSAKAARWVGPHLVSLGSIPRFAQIAARLRKTATRWKLSGDNFTRPEKFTLPLPGALELQAQISSLLIPLLALLLEHGIRFEPAGSKDSRVNDGLEWLAAQPLKHPFSRADLARLAGLSPSRLDRLWRNEIGVTPYQYWESRRLKYACDRLREPQRLIKEIAIDLGFSAVSRFSTWFRDHQDESPSQFRSHPETV